MYYTYVLEHTATGDRYIGFTHDLRQRVSEHNSGLVSATRHRRPWQVIYYEACLSKEKAIEREKYFKTGFGRRYLKNRL